MKIIGHRGYSKNYPENTMLAFKKAYEIGMDGIETDVQLTKDNQIVLIHDEKIDRTSNHNGYVKDYTLAELKSFNFNNHMPLYECPIPTLEELLIYVKDHPMLLNIEIKTSKIQYPNLEQMTYDMVKKYGLLDKTFFSSFHLPSLVKLKEIDPNLTLGYLYEDPKKYQKAWEVITEHKLQAAHPKAKFLQEADFRVFKDKKIDVNPWVVDDRKLAKKMKERGVKYLISNCKVL